MKFSPMAASGKARISVIGGWLCNFCAFSPAAKEHGFFRGKRLRLPEIAIIREFSSGVGTVSTAEFFGP
jgi:hypothetical protein